MPSPVAQAAEVPVYFSAGTHTLMGILTVPFQGHGHAAVVLATGGWHSTSADRNRWFVRIARELAGQGVASFRFDYHGVGESSGTIGRFDLDDPFLDDLSGALSFLRAKGFRKFILAGLCFGGRTALEVAARREDVDGLVLMSVPITSKTRGVPRVAGLAHRLSWREIARRGLRVGVIRGFADPKMRRAYIKAARARLRTPPPSSNSGVGITVDQRVWDALSALITMRVPILMMYGVDEDAYLDYVHLVERPDSDLNEVADQLQLHLTTSPLLGFSRLSIQDEASAAVLAWCRRLLSQSVGRHSGF
jgi:pimeloyl-ACP methyl ester carboxylesterase